MKAEEQRTVEWDAKKVVIENDRRTHKHTQILTQTHMDSHTHTYTDRQTPYRKYDRYTDTETNRHIHRHRDKQTHRDIDTETDGHKHL